MNTSYRSLWNHALGAWVAVSEVTRGRGKRASGGVAGAIAVVLLGSGAMNVAAQSYTYAPNEINAVNRPVGATTTLTVASGSAEQSGVLSGSTAGATMVKDGVGTLTLSGANTWTGNIGVQGGTLRVLNDGNLGNAGNQLFLSNAGTLQLGQSGFTTGRALRSNAGGTIDVAGTLDNVFSGTIAMSGTLRLINSVGPTLELTRLTLASSNNTGFTGGTQLGTAGGVGSSSRFNVDVTGAGTLGSGPVDIYYNAQLRYLGAAARSGDRACRTT